MSNGRARLLFWAMYAFFFLALMELLGWAGLCFLNGYLVTPIALRQEWKKTIGTEAPDGTSLPPGSFVLHPYLGYAMTPRDNRTERDTDRELMETYGFGAESGFMVKKRDPETVVIGIFGASVARQFWETQGFETLANELRKDPAFAGKDMVLSSAAMYAYTQPQPLLALSYLLSLGARYDIIVSIDGFNDVDRPPAQAVNNFVSPYYPRNWTTFVRDTEVDPVLRTFTERIHALRDKRKQRAQWIRDSVLQHSWTARFLWKVLDRHAQGVLSQAEFALQQHIPSLRGNYLVQGPLPQYPSEEEYFLDLIDVWKQSTLQFHRLAQGNGIRSYHFLQPNQYVPGSKPMGEKERKTMASVPSYIQKIPAAYPLLRTAGASLQKQGVRFTDLSMIFSSIKEPLYVDDCCHFNDRGHAIMAKEIARRILRDF